MTSAVHDVDISPSKISSHQNPWLIFLCFSLLVVLLRWSSFYLSVIDWDESLYLLVAKAWQEGNVPYTAIWDNKPPGIYAIFLAIISIFGHSILAIRAADCLFISATCFFLYKTGSLLERNGKAIGVLSGVLYALATSVNGGIATNTEIFFISFVVIGFYLFFSTYFSAKSSFLPNRWNLKLFIAGTLLGIGFEIKQVVLFDFITLFFILMFAIFLWNDLSNKYWIALQSILFINLGFILPFIIFSLYFWSTQHFDDYVYANFTANKLRTVNIGFSISVPLKAIHNQILNDKLWFSVPSIAIYLLIAKNIPIRERWILTSFVGWFCINLICISFVLRGFIFPHYYLQLSPSLCFLTSYILISLVLSGIHFKRAEFQQYLILAALLTLLINSKDLSLALRSNAKTIYFRHIKGINRDAPALISAYIKPRIKLDDYIYSVNEPIVYFLTNAKIPTKYAYPPFLRCCGMPNITGVNPLQELDLILQKRPVYISKLKTDEASDDYKQEVIDNELFFKKLNQTLHQDYHLENIMNGSELYRINSSKSSF